MSPVLFHICASFFFVYEVFSDIGAKNVGGTSPLSKPGDRWEGTGIWGSVSLLGCSDVLRTREGKRACHEIGAILFFNNIAQKYIQLDGLRR